jgi:hypothetical protein
MESYDNYLKLTSNDYNWRIKRDLVANKYPEQTKSIQDNLVPTLTSQFDIENVYGVEANLLNLAVFGIKAKEWKDLNPTLKGNIRDYATIGQLLTLTSLQTLNAKFIEMNMSRELRANELNKTAAKLLDMYKDTDFNSKLKVK